MTHRRRSTRGRLARLAHARQETALLLTGAAFLGSFVIIGMHAPAIYQAALAQMEEIKAEYQQDPLQDAERHLENLRRQVQDRRRELKNNFRGATLDPSPVEVLLTQWEQAIGTELAPLLEEARASGDTSAFWNRNQDFYYDYQQPVDEAFQKLYAQQSFQQIGRQIKDAERGAKDMSQSLKGVKKQLKEGDFSELQGYIDGYTRALESIKAQYAAIDVANADLQDKVQDIQYIFNDLYGDYSNPFHEKLGEQQEEANRVVQQKEAKKFAKQTKRTINDFARKVKRFQRKKLDIAELMASIEQLKSLAAEMQGIANSSDFDGETFWDLQSEFSERQEEAWETINVLEMQMNQGRFLKSTARELKNIERIVSDIREQAKHGGTAAEVLPELEDLLAQMKDVFSQANEAYRAKDYDEVQGFIEEFSGLQQDFYATQSSLYEEQEVQSLPSREEIEKLALMLEVALQKLASAVDAGTISSEVAGICRGTFKDAQGIVSEILVTFDRGGDAAEPFQHLQAVGEKLDSRCQEFVQ